MVRFSEEAGSSRLQVLTPIAAPPYSRAPLSLSFLLISFLALPNHPGGSLDEHLQPAEAAS